MTKQLTSILNLRLIVSYICENLSPPWWKSDIFGNSSIQMFEDIFPQTPILAQYHAAKNAGMNFHDQRLSKGTFHLFRLKEELEQDLHSYVLEHSDEQIKNIPTSLDDATSKLKLISEKNIEVRDGPYLIEHQDHEMDLFLLKQFAEVYLMAFNSNVKAIPYILTNE